MSQHELDARHLLCPMPVIRLQNAMTKLETGEKLTLYCTDPGTLQDIPCWCRMYGHTVLSQQQNETEIVFTIQSG